MGEEFLRVYLATALTGLDQTERSKVFSLSDEVFRICNHHQFVVYQPREHTDPLEHAQKHPREVYLTDRERVATSDLVIALCGHPSHGVGAENEIAAGAGVPVVYLVENGTKLSRMLSGSFCENRIVEWSDSKTLEAQLSSVLEELKPQLLSNRHRYAPQQDGKAFPNILKDLRERSGFKIDELATRAGLSKGQLEAFENKEEKVTTPTVNQIRSLAMVLGVPASYLLGETMIPSDGTAYQSIQTLKDFARKQRLSFSLYDSLRSEYLDSRRDIGFAAKTRDAAVLSEEDWEKRWKKYLERTQNLDLWE